MKLVVFGASGGVGKHVVEQALHKEHSVRAVYRAASTARPQHNLEAVSLSDFFGGQALSEAIVGADAVISCLGPRRDHPKNPWSKVISPLDLMECFCEALIEAMTQIDMPKRFVVVSAAGVGTSAPLMHPVLRFVFGHSNVGLAYRDLARMEEQIERSKLDWTIVRPVTLTTGPLNGEVKFCSRFDLSNSISRADVAAFLLRCVEEPQTISSRTPMICTR